jgi:hypothetical protein
MAKKTRTQQEHINLLALAHEMGLMNLNPQEKELIHLLRYTTLHGRNLVMELAMAIRCSHPWRYQPSDTQQPVFNEARFFELDERSKR